MACKTCPLGDGNGHAPTCLTSQVQYLALQVRVRDEQIADVREIVANVRRETIEACLDVIVKQSKTWDRGLDVHAELTAAADRIRDLRDFYLMM